MLSGLGGSIRSSFDLDPNPRGEFEEPAEASDSAVSDNGATDGVEGDPAVGCEALEGGESETIVVMHWRQSAYTFASGSSPPVGVMGIYKWI